MKPFNMIVACTSNKVIGCANKIPWYLPEDLKWFKKMTENQVVVMGRKTFQSIGKPLPNRHNIVITSQDLSQPHVQVLNSFEPLLDLKFSNSVWICGGAQVYKKALPFTENLYITWVKKEVSGDVFFPDFESLFSPFECIEDKLDYKIVWYKSISS